jgi:hypothetical protein
MPSSAPRGGSCRRPGGSLSWGASAGAPRPCVANVQLLAHPQAAGVAVQPSTRSAGCDWWRHWIPAGRPAELGPHRAPRRHRVALPLGDAVGVTTAGLLPAPGRGPAGGPGARPLQRPGGHHGHGDPGTAGCSSWRSLLRCRNDHARAGPGGLRRSPLPTTRARSIASPTRAAAGRSSTYPADDTPGCTTEACQFRDHHEVVSAIPAPTSGA